MELGTHRQRPQAALSRATRPAAACLLLREPREQGRLERGAARWLSPLERDLLEQARGPKRRREWLLGRLAAKRLVQRELARATGAFVPARAISIERAADGAPVVRCQGNGACAERWSLSLSHRAGFAWCALATAPGTRIGVDVELIEQRSPAFATDYFTAEEQQAAAVAPPERRDELWTAMWSAKESALKVLRLGLSVDARSVCCALRGDGQLGWSPLVARCCSDPPLLVELAFSSETTLGGSWRRHGPLVLTVVQSPSAPVVEPKLRPW